MSDEFDVKAATKALEDVNKAFDAFMKKTDQQFDELRKNGVADPITTEEAAKIREEVKANQAILTEYALAQKRQSRVVTDASGKAVDLDQKALDWADGLAKKRGERVSQYTAKEMNEYSRAFLKMARRGEQALSADEYKTLSVGSDADGGYAVVPDMSGRMVKQEYTTSPMRAYASVQVIGTDALKGVYDNDEAEIFWEGETETPQTGATPQLGEWRIPVREMRTLLKATQQSLDDAMFDLEAWLTTKGREKMGRAENAAFVSGSGVGRPRGFLTYPDGTDLTNSIKRFFTGVSGDFAAAPAGVDRLRLMMADLKPAYRSNANWFMNRTTEGEAMILKDSDGRPLWQPSTSAGTPSSLMGVSVAIFDDMPNTDAGALSIAYGDMRSAYQIVDRQGVSILRDPFVYKPHVGFYMRKRVGGDLVNGEALKLLSFSAS